MKNNVAISYQARLRQVLAEFEQYKRESIKWSVEDFMEMEDEYDITREQAQQALEAMISKHDCNHGITWDDVAYFKSRYGTLKA
jgi:hypothetical protein